MKIIKKLPGSFSSEVFLVKIDKKEYVLKRGNNASEILSEQEFFKVLSKNNIPIKNLRLILYFSKIKPKK